MIFRKATEKDAQGYFDVLQKVDSETKFMLFEPGERTGTVESLTKRLKSFEDSETDALLVAEDEGAIVGFLACLGAPQRRTRHRFNVVIGVAKSHWGQGVGAGLMRLMDEWAKEKDRKKAELTVVASNERAIRLYEKNGFVREGLRKNGLFIDGQFVDELYMAKHYV